MLLSAWFHAIQGTICPVPCHTSYIHTWYHLPGTMPGTMVPSAHSTHKSPTLICSHSNSAFTLTCTRSHTLTQNWSLESEACPCEKRHATHLPQILLPPFLTSAYRLPDSPSHLHAHAGTLSCPMHACMQRVQYGHAQQAACPAALHPRRQRGQPGRAQQAE